MRRANVYVDGFNLYYGALKDREGRKWLNIRTFCQSFPKSRDLDIRTIKYFTALVQQQDARKRQLEYIKALKTDANVHIIKGKIKYNEEKGKAKRRGQTSILLSTCYMMQWK